MSDTKPKCIMVIYLLFVTISVFLLQSVAGQTTRTTSACSVPLCPGGNTTNSSCSSNNQLCYAYQIPLTNQTFCAPSVQCSLFDQCINGVACSSNASVCLSSACCAQPICMPISLGVTTCNATVPTILPAQCYNYVFNSDATRNVAYTQSTSMCDSSVFSTPQWVRFIAPAGTQLATSFPGVNTCGTNYPGYLNNTLPIITGQIKTSTVCFGYSGACSYQTTISVTNCIGFNVYYLTSPPTCNLRYCVV